MKILILLLALTTAPMAFCDDGYQAIKYGDVITDKGEIISCDDLDDDSDDDLECDDN